jgi:sugar/nucleoside kinase (ribokinase family)
VSAPRFVAVGELMLDVSVAGRGHDARVTVAAGGSAAIAAAWAVEAGAEAAIIGRIGNDPVGRLIRLALEERGLETQLSVDPDAATGTFLLVDSEPHVDRGANASFTADDLPERLEGDAVLVSGYLPRETVDAALARAGAAWIAVGAGGLTQLPAGANALLADEDEARRLTGLDPEAAARELGTRFRLACVTRGAAGAVAVLDGACETVAGVAVTGGHGLGAGDAFAAGLLVSVARGAQLRDALEEAARLGARAAAEGAWPRVRVVT